MAQSTNRSKWRLKVDRGRQWWYYCETDEESACVPMDAASQYWLGLMKSKPFMKPATHQQAAVTGFNFYSQTQTTDGHFAGNYGGPMFLMPGFVIICYISQVSLEPHVVKEMIYYLYTRQNKTDGGWGLHTHGPSTMMGTTLNYVAARLLGVSADTEWLVRARKFILANGSALSAPPWAKFYFACLNIYDWQGVYPLTPEMWLLPKWFPTHPSRMWCHCRQVYLPMSYLYARRFQTPLKPLLQELRQEIYNVPYETIDWPKARACICHLDVYYPMHWFAKATFSVLAIYERWPIPFLRRKALAKTLDCIVRDSMATHAIGIGPVSKIIDMLVVFFAQGVDSSLFKMHKDRIKDYLWLGPDGMRVQGTNGSQLWDTALFVQAAYYARLYRSDVVGKDVAKHCQTVFQKSLGFLDVAQVIENVDASIYRQPNRGGWCFSTRDCGWIVSDCTAEGLKATLLLQNELHMDATIDASRLTDAANLLLSMQNADGGWATYERKRAGNWMEYLNPSFVFDMIMVDYSYVECTSAVYQALTLYEKHYPSCVNGRDITKAKAKALSFIKQCQDKDGGFYGSWGVCYTYGGWFAMEAMKLAGESIKNSKICQKACDFLLLHQRSDGGWGESWTSCELKKYIQHEKSSQVVQTSWAMLALMAANWDGPALERAANYLMKMQKDTGEWPLEDIMGVFNKTCMIEYPNYVHIFPIWALGVYAKRKEEHDN